MDERILTLENTSQEALANTAIEALEGGKVVYFPNDSFSLKPEEQILMSDTILDGKHKNVSFDYRKQRLSGYKKTASHEKLDQILHPFMQRFAEYAKTLIISTLPHYNDALIWGRTSYRPAEINGRASSKRKDDTRLHVDSFPATPVNGLRILRVFCNINPYGEPRVWHLGEPFNDVLRKFAPQIPSFSPLKAKFLHWVKATKTLRSAYDHYMLQTHDRMKLDDNYQQHVDKFRMNFPAQSSWIVFTDNVSHAALAGQYLLEQTFYLPVDAMQQRALSPLACWEKVWRNEPGQD